MASTTEIVGQIFALLEPLASEERKRVVRATLTLLGEDDIKPPAGSSVGGDAGESLGVENVSGQAALWMKQNGLSSDDIQQVFHFINDKAEVIAAVQGKSKKEQTINAYVLTGIASLLMSGDANFTDDAAREVCTGAGCYDANNHSTYLKDKGNLFSGSKGSGWALTAPGRKHGAELVKKMADKAS